MGKGYIQVFSLLRRERRGRRSRRRRHKLNLPAGLAGELAEQLRAILEPTRASRLAGDFRSGKRLAMRKVIAYIASHFRKDKIWLRRTRPDQRTYQARACAACAWGIVPVTKFKACHSANALLCTCGGMSRLGKTPNNAPGAVRWCI